MPENRDPSHPDTTPTGATTPAAAGDLERKLGELFTSRGDRDALAKAPPRPVPTPAIATTADDRLEAAFWRFDTLRGGQHRMADRDAFKSALRAYVAGTLEGDIGTHRPAGEDAGAMLARLGMDGHAWALEFLSLWGGRLAEVDEGLMIGWFCNAIMAGYDRGHAKGMIEARRALSVPLAPRGDGEPENTISRMVAAIEAAAVEVGPAGAERLRACWLEVQALRRGTAELLEQVRAERAAWIDRAAGLYYVIDRIDDAAEYLDAGAGRSAIEHQIARSHRIVRTDGGGREVWGDPPAARNLDGGPVWWPVVERLAAEPLPHRPTRFCRCGGGGCARTENSPAESR